ncbi:MAG: hypothetical protein ACRELB_11525 [Polyangiaceae bacterium]
MAPKSITRSRARAGLAKIDAELRAQLTPIEIGQKLVEAKGYYETLHPETRPSRVTGGGKKRSGQFDPFVMERARRSKKSESWVQQHVKLVTDIPADLHNMLNKSSIKDQWTTLADLSRQRPIERLRRVAELIIKNPKLAYRQAMQQTDEEFSGDDPAPVVPVVSERVALYPKSWESVTAREIEPGSVDAIISDIDWCEDTMGKLDKFVAFCRHALRPRGRVVLQTGQATAWKVEGAFRAPGSGFNYQWTLAYETFHESRPVAAAGVAVGCPCWCSGRGRCPGPTTAPT